jgi:hypothetical protein
MARSRSNLKSILVTVLLSAALAGVIYAMRYTGSYRFRKGLEVFFNPSAPQVWNWCPPDADKVEVLSSSHSGLKLQPNQICSVTVEVVPEDKATRKLSGLLRVSSAQATKTLEADDLLEVFSVDGLVFQSQNLSKTLKQP